MVATAGRVASPGVRIVHGQAGPEQGVGLGRLRIALVAVTLSAGLAGCVYAPRPKVAAAPPPPSCASQSQRATAELVFARVAGESPGPGVSEAEFSKFLNREVITRFHDGLTVLDAQDLTPKPAGGALYGPAKVVMIVLPGRPDDGAQLEAIRTAYKTRFNQQTVLEMTHQDCVTY
jgi:hypothetical protein